MSYSTSSPAKVLYGSEDLFDQQSYGRKNLGRTRHSHHRAFQKTNRIPIPSTIGIPMPSYHINRTESELQLHEDMAMAEYRDQCMFNRLVTGIKRQQLQQHYVSQQHQSYQDQEQSQSFPVQGSQDSHHRGNGIGYGDILSLITPIASVNEDTSSRPLSSTANNGNGNTTRRTRSESEQSSEVDDWAIEGFNPYDETPRSPMTPIASKVFPDGNGMQPQVIGTSRPRSLSRTQFGSSISSLRSDQLFVMDLWFDSLSIGMEVDFVLLE